MREPRGVRQLPSPEVGRAAGRGVPLLDGQEQALTSNGGALQVRRVVGAKEFVDLAHQAALGLELRGLGDLAPAGDVVGGQARALVVGLGETTTAVVAASGKALVRRHPYLNGNRERGGCQTA